jgi:hypothetical protein
VHGGRFHTLEAPMRKTALVTRWVIRLAGLTQIIMGLAFWSGRALSLIPVHMIIGLLVAIGLCVVAVLASRTGARPAVVLFAIGLGLVLPAFGVVHVGMLPGSWHWVIRLMHLGLGLAALGLADRLAEHVLQHGGTRERPEVSGTAQDQRVRAHGGASR